MGTQNVKIVWKILIACFTALTLFIGSAGVANATKITGQINTQEVSQSLRSNLSNGSIKLSNSSLRIDFSRINSIVTPTGFIVIVPIIGFDEGSNLAVTFENGKVKNYAEVTVSSSNNSKVAEVWSNGNLFIKQNITDQYVQPVLAQNKSSVVSCVRDYLLALGAEASLVWAIFATGLVGISFAVLMFGGSVWAAYESCGAV